MLKIFIFVIFGVLLVTNAFSTTIYEQPSIYPSGAASASEFNGYKTYDNFTLSSSSLIKSIHWMGGYYNPPEKGDIDGFYIKIWSNDNDRPSELLWSEYINDKANETFVGNVSNSMVYEYRSNLSNPFLATLGVQYWLTIQSEQNIGEPTWGWFQATTGYDPLIIALQSDIEPTSAGFNPSVQYRDYVFRLDDEFFNNYSGTIPEPNTIFLFGLGILGLAGVSRKKTA